MEKTVQAVYRNGVLEPLEELQLEESQQVTITVADSALGAEDPSGFFTQEEWAKAGADNITWAETQRVLSNVPGSLAETVIEQREER